MNATKTLHIFRPGRQTAMNGLTLEFSESDLAASAAAYDPAKHEAPIVIGHPKHDAPAYGWVKSLATAEDGLQAEPHQVDAAFAELVEAGRYKKISASFYLPDAPNNPVPGVYYLRHVGFLGAQPPAVKGLKAAEFADAEDGVVEFGDWGMESNASYDPTKNPTTELALGHVTFDLEFMPPTPAERITFESFINIELLKQLGQTA